MSDQCDHDWTRLKSLVLYPLGNQNAPAPLEWCKHCGLLRMAGFKPRDEAAKAEVKPALKCPFCSEKGSSYGVDVKVDMNNYYYVECQRPGCKARGSLAISADRATSDWKSMHLSSPLDAAEKPVASEPTAERRCRRCEIVQEIGEFNPHTPYVCNACHQIMKQLRT